MKIVNVSHFGLCVSDVDASLRFYCDGLGFSRGETFEVGDECRDALEVDGEVALRSEFIERDGFAIELLGFASPGAQGEPSRRRNQRGLTHLALYVEDLETVADRLVSLGGSRLDATRTSLPEEDGSSLEILFVADPDGTRVELLENRPPTPP